MSLFKEIKWAIQDVLRKRREKKEERMFPLHDYIRSELPASTIMSNRSLDDALRGGKISSEAAAMLLVSRSIQDLHNLIQQNAEYMNGQPILRIKIIEDEQDKNNN